MRKYKELLIKELRLRKFDLIQIQSKELSPYWMEARWIILSLSPNSAQMELYVNFLIDRSADGDTKLVNEVVVTTSKMKNYHDRKTEIATLNMNKGNFDEKLIRFLEKLK